VAKSNLITGIVQITSFDQYLTGPTGAAVNCTANVSTGSPNISAITNGNFLYVGLEISNANFPGGTTVVSINYGANTAVLSNNATGTATGTTLTVVFPDGLYFCPSNIFSDINGSYNNTNITEGFQIINNALDANTFNPLNGVFNLWKISHVSYRNPNLQDLSFYVVFDEEAPYSDTGHTPQNGNSNAITEQTQYRKYGWNVSSQLYPSLQAGSDVAQGNLDAQNVSDFFPVIYGPTGPGITGAWEIGFTGAGVSSVSRSTADYQGGEYEKVIVTISGGAGSTGATGATGATGESYIIDGSAWTYAAGGTGNIPGDFAVTTSSGSSFVNVTSIYVNKIDYNANDYSSLLLYLETITAAGGTLNVQSSELGNTCIFGAYVATTSIY
jgi:hypothetical protein